MPSVDVPAVSAIIGISGGLLGIVSLIWVWAKKYAKLEFSQKHTVTLEHCATLRTALRENVLDDIGQRIDGVGNQIADLASVSLDFHATVDERLRNVETEVAGVQGELRARRRRTRESDNASE